MEGNKDEADRCLDYAEKFAEQGLREKAEKFILKAEKLYPTERAKTLLSKLDKMQSNQGRRSSEETDSYVRHRQNANKENSATSNIYILAV